MGLPDRGNKAQTSVGYSHGTGVSNGDLATAITGVHPRVTLGLTGHIHVPMLALLVLATGCGEQLNRSGCVWSHNSMGGSMGYARVLQVDDEWRVEKDVSVDV